MRRLNRSLYILLVSLAANMYMIFVLDGAARLQLSYPDERDRLFREVKEMAAKAIEGFDFESLDSPKALLFHSVIDCILKPLKVTEVELEEAEQGEVNKSSITKSSILQIVDVKTLRKFAMKLEAEVQAKKSVISFLTQPVLNHHNYVYIHNPSDVCTLHRTEVLLVVPSAPGNFENRAKVRLSKRGGYVRNWRNGAVLLFFIGNPPNDESGIEVQTKIDKESALYGDIVQENFEDVYKNIRLKAVSMLKWACTFCQETKYVIRTDDDVRVDIPKLLSVLEAKSRRYTDFIIGDRKDGWAAVRDTTDKYYLSVDEYEPSTLPPFAVGGLLGYPISTVTLLYQAALRIKPVWLDDIFITGICAPRVNVPLLSDPDFVFKHKVW